MTSTAIRIVDQYFQATPEDRKSVAQAIISDWAEANPQIIVPSFWAMFGVPIGSHPPKLSPSDIQELQRRAADHNNYLSDAELEALIDEDAPAESQNALDLRR